MADIVLDMSGLAGLSNGHAGDSDMVTPQPNLRVAENDNEFVGGLFNPYLRKGYMAPITTTTTTVTADTTPASHFIASEYDQESDTTYWADDTDTVYFGSSLNDTSLVDTIDLSSNYDELYDLQIYVKNSSKKLFFVGKGFSDANVEDKVIGSLAASGRIRTVGLTVQPAASTKPTISNEQKDESIGLNVGSDSSSSYTTVSGTNVVLWAVVFTSSTQYATNATFNSVAGTLLSSASSNPSCSVFYWVNPGVATSTVDVTFSATMTADDAVYYIFQTDNTNQTTPGEVLQEVRSSGTNIFLSHTNMSQNQLVVAAGYAEQNPILTTSFVNESLFDEPNNYGHDFLIDYSYDTNYGLITGISDVDGSNVDATWSSGTATNGFVAELNGDFAFMRVADNGFAYIFHDNSVDKADGNTTGGADGTITKNVLLFPDYFRIQDAVDYRSRLYIAINQSTVTNKTTSLSNYNSKCGVYVWNRISTQLSAADYIELPGVREIKKIYASPDGVLKLITINANGITELRRFGYNDSGGVVFPVFKELGIGAYPQLPDGCTVAGDKTIWLANNGVLYCEKGNVVTKLYEAKAPGSTSTGLAQNISSGAILYGSASETASTGYRSNKQGIFMSYNDGSITNEKIYPFDLTTGSNGSQTPHQGDVYSGVKYIPMHSIVRRIRLYNAPITTTGTDVIATIKIYFNQSSTPGITKSITKSEASRGFVDFNISKPYIHAVQIEVEWATGTPIGADMYLPSVGIIMTEDTGVKAPDSE